MSRAWSALVRCTFQPLRVKDNFKSLYIFLFFEIWNTVYNFKTSLQNLAAGIQQNKQNTHKSMSTLGTIVYNSDLFSDINMINTIVKRDMIWHYVF